MARYRARRYGRVRCSLGVSLSSLVHKPTGLIDSFSLETAREI
jgi:hypothetical protein